MYYDRRVKYFDYRKDGERLRGGGFAKLEARGESCKLQIQISGLHMTDTFSKQIYLVAKSKEAILGTIELQGGRGILQKQLPVDNLCNGISYGELLAIRIPIAAGCELYCQVEEIGQPLEAERINEVEQSVDVVSITEAEGRMDEPLIDVVSTSEAHEIMDAASADTTEQKTMLGNKWEQLSAIYPHIQPFQDERDYLQLGPQDFVVLGRRSYQLAHNSFLLHGYYNYAHLILTRQEWRNEERYYIGVPGNFYEREKQVALMFGFESFECKEEPADMGVFGYYMIRVDI